MSWQKYYKFSQHHRLAAARRHDEETRPLARLGRYVRSIELIEHFMFVLVAISVLMLIVAIAIGIWTALNPPPPSYATMMSVEITVQ